VSNTADASLIVSIGQSFNIFDILTDLHHLTYDLEGDEGERQGLAIDKV
jgi:hypothetical protein